MGRRRTFKGFKAFSFVAGTMLALAGCQPPPAGGDFHPLASGSLENVGAVIEEPGVFRIVGGQSFTTPFSVGCTKLDASANGWQAALAAGAHRVAIYLPGHPRIYGGVLALCTIHKTASGPSSRSYQLVIPESKVQDAQDGLISSVAEQVSVNRQEMPEMTALQMMQQGLTLSQQGAAAALQQTPQPTAITDDYAWMLWFTDRPAILGVNFQPSGVNAPPPPPPSSAPVHAAPPLVKGATYTVGTALNLRSGPGTGSPVVAHLSPGDSVIAAGEEKGGFWSVTTAGGQSGWVSARSLKPN